MKSLRLTLCFLAFVALTLPIMMSQEKKSDSNSAAPKYDPAAEVKVNGVIETAKDYACPVSGGMGAHLTVKTPANEVIEIHLAPTRFLSQYGIAFAKGDEVQIRGSKVTLGSPALLARQIERGNDMFFFRDAKGHPLW